MQMQLPLTTGLQPPPTPQNTSQIAWLVRTKKIQLAQESDTNTRGGIYEDLIDQLSRFGIAKERDQQLIEKSFEQWR